MDGSARMTSGGNRGADDGDGACEIIHVPNKLRAKISGGTEMDPGLLEDAQNAIDNMADEFRMRTSLELEKVHKLAKSVAKSDKPGDIFDQIFHVVHDLKGQGSTFGYTLLTEISNSLCRYIEKIETPSVDNMMIVMPHVDALRAVMRHNVHGDDDPIGAQIVESLRLLRKRAA